MSEDLGLVWLHVVAPPEMETDLTSVSENWGNFGGAGEETPRRRRRSGGTRIGRLARGNLNGGRPVRFQEWIDDIRAGPAPEPQLQAHAAAARAVAVPARPATATGASRTTRSTGLSSQSFEDQGQLDVLLPAPRPADDVRRPPAAEAVGQAEGRGHVGRRADRGRGRPRRGVPARARSSAGAFGRDTAAEIAPIPLFIKAPGQTRAEVDDAYVETIDILPTIFDILNLDPQRGDGREVGVQRRGAEPRRAALPDPQHASRRCASRRTRFEAERREVLARNAPPDRDAARTASSACTGSAPTRS